MPPVTTRKKPDSGIRPFEDWLRGTDLNGRPSGYEPDELPDCSTPRIDLSEIGQQRQTSARRKQNAEWGGRKSRVFLCAKTSGELLS